MVSVNSDVAKGNHKSDNPDSSEDTDGGTIQAAHDKACALAKLAEAGEADEKFSKDWVKSKISEADKILTAIHDFIVNDKEATDTNEHGDDVEGSGTMDGGFIISIERALK